MEDWSLLLTIFSYIVGICVLVYIYQLICYDWNIPGPFLWPVIGNALEISPDPKYTHLDLIRLMTKYHPLIQMWLGPFIKIYGTVNPKIVEKVLASSKNVNKLEDLYRMLRNWLGDGLLISTGKKWRTHRKLLTPAFHFTILEEAMETLHAASNVFIKRLDKYRDGQVFDVQHYVAQFTLDVICETAMGLKVNAQTKAGAEYNRAVDNICRSIYRRANSVPQRIDFIFKYCSANGKLFYDSLKVLRNMTERVIRERRQTITNDVNDNKIDDFGRKKKMAFLDVLLKSSIHGKPLTDEDIREEVDTFMFEGHDTVATALQFTLLLLANHPEIQERAFQECVEALGSDPTKLPTISDLNNLNYLERVIKESMRLYPPVPLFGRTLTEKVEIDGKTLPAGANLLIFVYQMHRDPEIYPNPEKFDPDRFLNEKANHFAYVPFSAGPRNCIGQKFAMLELKCTIAKVLRWYELLTAEPVELYKPQIALAVVIKSLNGINIRLRPRKY